MLKKTGTFCPLGVFDIQIPYISTVFDVPIFIIVRIAQKL